MQLGWLGLITTVALAAEYETVTFIPGSLWLTVSRIAEHSG